MERRLAAILAADVAGYTALMGADEPGTLKRLNDLRNECLEPLISEHNGRIVKLMGDGLLVEFASVVDAVTCALAWQDESAKRDEALKFRIGINVGDVIVEGEDIHGDGVNIASRIESLAEPGGICISGDAHRQISGKIEADFEDLGEQALKNVAQPVRIYGFAGHGTGRTGSALENEPLALPDRPSLAVLPFANMSADPEQEYFSDGITEDIITELSRFRSLFVIARNSSFVFRGKAVDIQDVGKKLGVQFVVEGSVRKVGKRVRVTAQLVETDSGNHIWAERYDRDLNDIFAVQDEVAQTIVSTVAGRLDDAGVKRAQRKLTDNMSAYDFLLRGLQHLHRYTKAATRAARPFIETAIEIDPNYSRAHAVLGLINFMDSMWESVDQDALDSVLDCAQRAMTLDNNDPWAHMVSAAALSRSGKLESALNYIETAYDLNPNDPFTLAIRSGVLGFVGRHDEALEAVETGIRLDPFHPDWMYEDMAIALYTLRRYADAIEALKKMKDSPYWVHLYLAACLAQLGRTEEARHHLSAWRSEAELANGRPPNMDSELYDFKLYKHQEDTDHWLDGLRKAGLDI